LLAAALMSRIDPDVFAGTPILRRIEAGNSPDLRS
jgi:hypothetical protein